MPEIAYTGPLDYGDHSTQSLILEYLQESPLFVKTNELCPGNLVLVQLLNTISAHHLILILPNNCYVTVMRKTGVVVRCLNKFILNHVNELNNGNNVTIFRVK